MRKKSFALLLVILALIIALLIRGYNQKSSPTVETTPIMMDVRSYFDEHSYQFEHVEIESKGGEFVMAIVDIANPDKITFFKGESYSSMESEMLTEVSDVNIYMLLDRQEGFYLYWGYPLVHTATIVVGQESTRLADLVGATKFGVLSLTEEQVDELLKKHIDKSGEPKQWVYIIR